MSHPEGFPFLILQCPDGTEADARRLARRLFRAADAELCVVPGHQPANDHLGAAVPFARKGFRVFAAVDFEAFCPRCRKRLGVRKDLGKAGRGKCPDLECRKLL